MISILPRTVYMIICETDSPAGFDIYLIKLDWPFDERAKLKPSTLIKKKIAIFISSKIKTLIADFL